MRAKTNLKTNLNPIGPPSWWKAQLSASLDTVTRYPDLWSQEVDNTVAAIMGSISGSVLTLSGLSNFISLLPSLFPSGVVTAAKPTYWGYRTSFEAFGRSVGEMQGLHGRIANGSFSLDDGTSLLMMCNPNNPTAEAASPPDVNELVRRNPKTWFVIDETYGIFEPNWTDYLEGMRTRPHNACTLVSLSKYSALPGLRVGFLHSNNQAFVADLRSKLGPVRNSTLAETFLPKLLEDMGFWDATQDRLAASQKERQATLSEVPGIHEVVRGSLFSWFDVSGFNRGHGSFHKRLLDSGISVLDGEDYGFPDYVRFREGSPSENLLLLSVLREISHGWTS